ncbi:hypothetical protein HY605_05370 [Candidatus Peregrinibacteria bacterium]|nr:hypothetical protein [Candidatus Peregrinibacteria bacterium]
MNMIPIVSIILEVVIALLALVACFRGQFYMIGFALTFGIYVYYDLARLYEWEVSESLLSVAFLIATVAALISMIALLQKGARRE